MSSPRPIASPIGLKPPQPLHSLLGGPMSELFSVENDLRAIEALNQRDVQFALSGDAAAMMSQWTDDFVLLPPAGPILRGRSVIAEAFRGVESPEIVEYA